MKAKKRPPGYSYRKHGQPEPDKIHPTRGAVSLRLRFRLFGLHARVLPLYRQAGCPFGESNAGLLLWLEFGRGSRSN